MYFSVPIAHNDAVCFNSHRVFNPKTIINTFDKMELVEFSFIHDYKVTTYKGREAVDIINKGSYKLSGYDCGIFIFRKRAGNVYGNRSKSKTYG